MLMLLLQTPFAALLLSVPAAHQRTQAHAHFKTKICSAESATGHPNPPHRQLPQSRQDGLRKSSHQPHLQAQRLSSRRWSGSSRIQFALGFGALPTLRVFAAAAAAASAAATAAAAAAAAAAASAVARSRYEHLSV